MVGAMAQSRNRLDNWLVWTAVSVLGAFGLAMVALVRGERVSALWMVVACIAVYLVAMRNTCAACIPSNRS
jgi:carbon starvation protein